MATLCVEIEFLQAIFEVPTMGIVRLLIFADFRGSIIDMDDAGALSVP